MINYYEILGLERTAGIAEIKASFRSLAKQYHPDRNPEGKEKFEVILKAYETLSEPDKKITYDYKLSYYQNNNSAENKTAPKTKNWKFDERELKRRQYYEEHIKKHSKNTETYLKKKSDKKSYNEFRYILYATPLAVALFLLIMNLANPRKHKPGRVKQEEVVPAGLKNGDIPYRELLGIPQYDTISNQSLKVNNAKGGDVIIAMYNKNGLVRSLFIKEGYSAHIPQLPAGELEVYYCSGYGFDPARKIAGYGYGAFSGETLYYKSKFPIRPDSINELTLTPGNSTFAISNQEEFFTHR